MKWKFLYCLILLFTHAGVRAQAVIPGFTAPDTVCINTPFLVKNTTTGASNYYWSFCSANLNAEPEIQNLGSFSGSLNQPVFVDYVFTNNQYYGFVTNYRGGDLIRLDFGNSLLNSPATTNLGNFNGLLPSNVGAEGIQLVQNEGKWYAIIVSGYTPSGSDPKVIRIAFGTNIDNPTPVATDWGNPGNLYQPIDLHIFQENNQWYGLTVNAENNTLTRFNFGTSFENAPTAVNLGNIGGLQYPTGLYAIYDNGTWRVFITNAGDRTRTNGEFSLTRLDFGNSLLNTPAGTNLGDLGQTLGHPRDITIIRSCDETIGFVVNGHPGYNNIVRLNFNQDLTSQPSATSLDVDGFDFPHSISKLFRVNEDVYGFITDAQNNTISRIRFKGCNNASIPGSEDKDPQPISYNQTGTYNINLTVDIGLPTQSSFCKQVVVVDCYDSLFLGNDTTICEGTSLQLKTLPSNNYRWTPAKYLDDPSSANPIATPPENITYYFEGIIPGRRDPIRDSLHITVITPHINATDDTTICSGTPIELIVEEKVSLTWTPAASLSDAHISNPIATPASTTKYHVTGVDEFGCVAKDSVVISVLPRPEMTVSNDTLICKGALVPLKATGGANYKWIPAFGLNDPLIADPIAATNEDRWYKVKVSGNNLCTVEDSVKISIIPVPRFNATGIVNICSGSPTTLTASGGDNYLWTSSGQYIDATSPIISPSPISNTTYTVNISENACHYDTTININVTVRSLPEFSSLPNAFTPNSDGKNDCFGIRHWGDAKVEQFTIYNRWGQIVFSSKGPSECWDGTLNGIPQPQGGYVYIVRAGTVCGLVTHKSILTLIR